MNCTKCELHKTCKSIQVNGRGSDHPRFLFVGITPGVEEDEQGRCWVGPCGQMLQDAIEQYNLKPARITNAVRCFPPSDRAPKKVEIEACQEYLFDEIKKYKPEIIVAVGGVPLRALTGKEHITEYSGRQVGERFGAKIFAIVHPSYVLRSPKNQTMFENHLQALKNFGIGAYKKMKHVKIENHWDALRDYFNGPGGYPFATFDFETTGEYKQYGGKIRLAGIRYNGKSHVMDAQAEGFDIVFKQFLQGSGIKCAYNSIFESRWCLDHWGIMPKNLIYDPMFMHFLLDENKPHALETVAGDFLGVDPWDIQPLMTEKKWNWETIPLDKLADYNALDCEYTHKLAILLQKKLKEDKGLYWFYKNVLLPVSRVCAKLEHRGMAIDTAWAAKVDREYEEDCAKIEKELSSDRLVKNYIGNRVKTNAKFKFNLGSPAQISDIVFKVMKEKVLKKTNGGGASASKIILEKIRHKNSFVDKYLVWNDMNTNREVLQKYPSMTDSKGLIHPNFNPAFQVTTRISISNPPAGNLQKEGKVRGIICTRFKDGKIGERDFSQLELRLIANESEDPTMLEVYRKNLSIHEATAVTLFGKDFNEVEYKKAKTVNFTIIYGATGYTVAEKLNIPVQEGEILAERMQKKYPAVFRWLAKQHDFVKKNGYVRNHFGVMRRFPEIFRLDPNVKSERKAYYHILRQAGNFPIQSVGAAINNLSGIYIDKAIEVNEYKSIYFHQVHDSTLVDCHPDEIGEMKNISEKIMEEYVPNKFCPWLKVPLKTDFKLTKRWGYNDDK